MTMFVADLGAGPRSFGRGDLLKMHLFVIAYEEPTLRQTFGAEYETYCRQVSRWWPRKRA